MKKIIGAFLSGIAALAASNIIVVWPPVQGVTSYDIYFRSTTLLPEVAFNTTLTNPFFDVSAVFAEKPYGTYEMTISYSGVAIHKNLLVSWHPPEATPKSPEGVRIDKIK